MISISFRHLGLFLIAAASVLLIGACGPSVDEEEETAFVDVNVQAILPETAADLFRALASGTTADVQSVGVEVRETPFDTGTPVLAETALTFTTLWEGTLPSLPVGISLDFRAIAYNDIFDGTSFLGTPIFQGEISETLSVAGPNDIAVDMTSIDDGTQPSLPTASVTMPTSVLVGTSASMVFTINHSASVEYVISVVDGSLTGPVTGTVDPAVDGTVTVTYTAPSSTGTDFITITMNEPGDLDNSSSVIFPITVAASVSGSVTTLFGPAITGINFSRTLNNLSIGVDVDSSATPLTYAWTGSGSFSALAQTTNPISITPFDDAMSGNTTVAVTDTNSITASLTHSINAGDFPFDQNFTTRLSDALISYDTFGGSTVDGSRWDKGEASVSIVDAGGGGGNALRLHANVANTAAQHGFKGGWDVRNVTPEGKSFQATITATELQRADTSAEGIVRLQIRKKATSGTDSTDSAVFGYRLRDRGQGPVRSAAGFICIDPNCDTTQGFPIVSDTFSGGSISLNTPHTVKLTLDDVAKTVTLEDLTAGESRVWDISAEIASGRIDLANSRVNGVMRARIHNFNLSYPIGGSGSITMLFDDVSVDGTLLDNFSAGTQIDGAKWSAGNHSRDIVGGQAVFTQSQTDRPFYNVLRLLFEHPVNALSADVTVVSSTDNAAVVANPSRALLGGYFYNDGSTGDGIGGRNGEIWSEIAINGSEVNYIVVRCITHDCSTHSSVTPGWVTLLPVNLNEPHKLYIAWDPSTEMFTYQVDSNPPVSFDPVAAGASVTGPPKNNSMRRVVGTRVTVESGESGTINAKIDNVRVGIATSKLAAGLPLYDDFSSGIFEPDLWNGAGFVDSQVANNTVTMSVSGNVGAWEFAVMTLPAVADIRGLSINARITDETDSTATASVRGKFYEDTGFRAISAQIFKDSQGISWVVRACDRFFQTNCVDLYSNSLASSVPATFQQLAVIWDGSTTFFAQGGSVSDTFDAGTAAPFASQLPPSDEGYDLAFMTFANFSAGTQGTNNATVEFQNPLIDQNGDFTLDAGPYDPFAGTAVDPTKWQAGPSGRRVTNGEAVFYQQAGGEQSGLDASALVRSIAADMTVTAHSGDAFSFVGTVYFLNLDDGDVNGLVGLTDTQALGMLVTCGPIAGDACTIVHVENLGSVSLNTTHTVFTQYDSEKITFQLDDNLPVHLFAGDITETGFGSVLPDGRTGGFLGTNTFNTTVGADLGVGATGSSSVTIDNVRLGGVVPVP